MPTFRTTLLQSGNNVGIDIPEEVVAGFGAGKKPPVTVTIAGYTYRSTVAVMGGKYLVGVNAAHRFASGVKGGEEHDMTLELDAAPRTVEVPDDLSGALADAGVRAAFDGLAYSKRKEHVRTVIEAKKPETRRRRVAGILAQLGG